jgi:subtilisin family serine protease
MFRGSQAGSRVNRGRLAPRTRSALLAAATLVAIAAAASRPAHGGGPEAAAGNAVRAAFLAGDSWVRVIVSLREPEAPLTSYSLQAGEIEAAREDVLSRMSERDFHLTARWTLVPGMAGAVSQSGLRKLLEHPDVARVDLDVPIYKGMAEVASLIKSDQAHAAGATGGGVVVAILDTGVDSTHPDIKDSLVAEACFCANADGSGCCPNGTTKQEGAGSAKDDDGHGTNVAGIITGSGRVAPEGVAPDASIVAVKVIGKMAAGSLVSGFISGLDWIVSSRPEVKVVNMSAGTGDLFTGTCDSASSFTQSFASAINTLKARGTTTFAATLNNGNPTSIAAPACIAAAIAVGATYDANIGTVSFGCVDATTAPDQIGCFSNMSSKVKIVAPGGAITSAGLGGGTSTYIGTSQACPVAAGVAALLYGAKPSITPDEVSNALIGTGVSVRDPRNGLELRRVDAREALRQGAGK